MNPEQLLPVGNVRLCVQTFGNPADPAVLLVHGACASMLWWQTELCERLAATGRFVIRYDQRDTGRSSTFPVGRPGYGIRDLTADAIGILDALGIERCHLVGRSMSGAVALIAGVDHPDRIDTLTFVCTTTGELAMAETDDQDAGSPAPDVDPEPDFADPDAVVDYAMAQFRSMAGRSPHFDEQATRDLLVQDVARMHDPACTLVNHFAINFEGPRSGGFGDVRVPTLVVHGEIDPWMPLAHGEALRDAVPGAQLLVLPQTGHDVPRVHWDLFVDALARHTGTGHGG